MPASCKLLGLDYFEYTGAQSCVRPLNAAIHNLGLPNSYPRKYDGLKYAAYLGCVEVVPEIWTLT